MMDDIKPGDVFTHNETGVTCVVDLTGKMKQEAGMWSDAVTYHRASAPEAKFTRSAEFFKRLFTRGSKE